MQEKVFPARPPAAPMGVPSSDGFVLVRTAEKRPRRRAPRPRKRYSREDNYTHHGVALGTWALSPGFASQQSVSWPARLSRKCACQNGFRILSWRL